MLLPAATLALVVAASAAEGPCDILDAAGNTCVAAHSTTRALCEFITYACAHPALPLQPARMRGLALFLCVAVCLAAGVGAFSGVGGKRDAHGCCGSCGYQFSNTCSKCV